MRFQTIMAASAFVAAGLSSSAALAAQNIGQVADGLQEQVGSIANLVGAAAFLLGVLLVIMGLMKFKQRSDNPNDPSAKVSTAIVLVAVGAAMIALPTLAGVGITSLFGSGANSLSVDGGLQSID